MFQFEEKIYLQLLWSLPVFIAVAMWYANWQKRKAAAFFAPEQLHKLAPNISAWRPKAKFILWTLAILTLIFGLAGPKVGTKLETLEREGADIVFLLDVSNSMLVEDVKPNRLERAKLILSRSLEQLAGDRLGIVAYAGVAVQQLPITNDYRAARMALQTTDHTLISAQGTDIGDAILRGIKSFEEGSDKNKVLFILSDGEDHEGSFEGALKEAKKAGVKIYAFGLGTPNGGPVPDIVNGRKRGYIKDMAGEVAVSMRDEATLQQIARETGGNYFVGNNTQDAVAEINKIVSGLEKTSFESKVFTDYEHQFQWFLGIAFILLLFEFLLSESRSYLLEKLGIFKEK
ncbi:MAG: VWA domain-containing protein [Schleiferiaceae bacterium]|nr:VWA domain-containing protein [Schleiferiaceae bacterium]